MGENNSECQLLSEDKKFKISLPELDGATCLASAQGWLLVSQESSGSLFFLCPFSRAKIDIPNIPDSQLYDPVAAFSSPPTSKDCIVCIIGCRPNSFEWELNELRRGSIVWTKHTCTAWYCHLISTLTSATYHHYDKAKFYFFDHDKKFLTFSTENQSWDGRQIANHAGPDSKKLQFRLYKDYFQKKNSRNRLGLAEDVSVAICGTQIDGALVCGENITAKAAEDQAERRQYKGVWIHPRFHQISSNYQS